MNDKKSILRQHCILPIRFPCNIKIPNFLDCWQVVFVYSTSNHPYILITLIFPICSRVVIQIKQARTQLDRMGLTGLDFELEFEFEKVSELDKKFESDIHEFDLNSIRSARTRLYLNLVIYFKG